MVEGMRRTRGKKQNTEQRGREKMGDGRSNIDNETDAGRHRESQRQTQADTGRHRQTQAQAVSDGGMHGQPFVRTRRNTFTE